MVAVHTSTDESGIVIRETFADATLKLGRALQCRAPVITFKLGNGQITLPTETVTDIQENR